jgi:integrase
MTGSLQKKNDHFYMVANEYEDGKRRQRWVATGLPVKGNKRRAEKMLAELLASYDVPPLEVRSSAMLFDDYIKVWLADSKKRVDEVTYAGYEHQAEHYVIPYFETRQLTLGELERKHIQAFFDEKAEHGNETGGALATGTLQKLRTIINCTLGMAVDNELISVNPCNKIKLPKPKLKVNNWLTTEQFNQFLAEMQKNNEQLYPLIRVTGFYGLRKSEALGIKWSAVDFERGVIKIQHVVVESRGVRVAKDNTKNASSNRELPMNNEIAELLRTLKTCETANRETYGNTYVENDYVFKWDNGRPYPPNSVTSKFSELLDYYGYPHMRFHDLRHSCASQMLADNWSIVDVSKWLGHATPTVTANVYSHLDQNRKQDIANSRLKPSEKPPDKPRKSVRKAC